MSSEIFPRKVNLSIKTIFYHVQFTSRQTQFWEAGTVRVKFYSFLQIYIVCNIENGFHWLVYFYGRYLRGQNLKMLVFNQNRVFEQRQFSNMDMVVLRSNIASQSGIVSNIENGFYWHVCFFCECLNCQRYEKCWFLNKVA